MQSFYISFQMSEAQANLKYSQIERADLREKPRPTSLFMLRYSAIIQSLP